MRPGQVERRTHDYDRHGTTTLFAALNVKTSEVITQFHQRHRSAQFREFLDLIETQVPRDLEEYLHIIMDNYGTHKTPLIRNWFAKRPRFHVHFTPTYGSWLSLVERWFAELTNKQLRRGAYPSVPKLKTAIQEFIDAHQEHPKPYGPRRPAKSWRASRDSRSARRPPRRTTCFTNHWDRTLGARRPNRTETGLSSLSRRERPRAPMSPRHRPTVPGLRWGELGARHPPGVAVWHAPACLPQFEKAATSWLSRPSSRAQPASRPPRP